MSDSTNILLTETSSRPSVLCTCELPVAQSIFGCPRPPCGYHPFDARHAIHHHEASSMRDRLERMGLPLVAADASVFDGQLLPTWNSSRNPAPLLEWHLPPLSISLCAWEPPNLTWRSSKGLKFGSFKVKPSKELSCTKVMPFNRNRQIPPLLTSLT